MLSLLVSVGWAGDAPCSVALMARQAQRATVTLLEGQDFERFEFEAAGVHETLSCVTDPLGAGDAARVHRVLGLEALLDGDSPAALSHFAAAEALDANWMLPASWDSTELDDLVRSSRDRTVWLEPPTADSASALSYDGTYTHRPANVATIAQLRGPSGTLRTYVLRPGEVDLFAAALDEARPAVGLPPGPLVSQAQGAALEDGLDLRSVGWGWGRSSVLAGGLTVASGAASLATYGVYRGAERESGQLEGVYRANHVLIGTTVGLGVLTAGCAAGWEVTGSW